MCFVHCKTFSIRIHALFSKPVVGFAPDPHWGYIPGLPLGDFRPETPNLLTPGKNPAGAHALNTLASFDQRKSIAWCVLFKGRGRSHFFAAATAMTLSSSPSQGGVHRPALRICRPVRRAGQPASRSAWWRLHERR